MRDLREAVRERVAPLRLDPHQEADVVEELAQELEERHARVVSEGRSVDEADDVVRRELASESFSSEIRAALQAPAPRPAPDAGLAPEAGRPLQRPARGPALRGAAPGQEPRLHPGRGGVARPRRGSQHHHLLARERGAPQPAPHPRARARRLRLHDRRQEQGPVPELHVDVVPELQGLPRAERAGPQRHGRLRCSCPSA